MYGLVIKQGYKETRFEFKNWSKLMNFAEDVLDFCVENGIEIIVKMETKDTEPALEDGFDSGIVND